MRRLLLSLSVLLIAFSPTPEERHLLTTQSIRTTTNLAAVARAAHGAPICCARPAREHIAAEALFGVLRTKELVVFAKGSAGFDRHAGTVRVALELNGPAAGGLRVATQVREGGRHILGDQNLVHGGHGEDSSRQNGERNKSSKRGHDEKLYFCCLEPEMETRNDQKGGLDGFLSVKRAMRFNGSLYSYRSPIFDDTTTLPAARGEKGRLLMAASRS